MSTITLANFGLIWVATQAALAQSLPPDHAKPPRVTVDGQLVRFPDMQPRFMYNHAMVPMRGVFERLHSNVAWDGRSHQITCVKDDATVQLMLGDTEATVNGVKVRFDAPATLSHGRTLVPLRFLAQSLGARVEWDDASQTVKISTTKYINRGH